MAEIVADNIICDSCGADIRSGSLFCYSCGETVAETEIEEEAVNDSSDSADKIKEAAIDSEMRAAFEKTEANPKTNKLRSAASMRKRTKAYNRQPVEFVWEQRVNSSRGFVIGTIVLAIFTGIILFLALYLR